MPRPTRSSLEDSLAEATVITIITEDSEEVMEVMAAREAMDGEDKQRLRIFDDVTCILAQKKSYNFCLFPVLEHQQLQY